MTTAAFFCVALVGTIAKVSGKYTSTGVILLFQNVIGLVFVIPVVARGGWSTLRTERFGLHFLRPRWAPHAGMPCSSQSRRFRLRTRPS